MVSLPAPDETVSAPVPKVMASAPAPDVIFIFETTAASFKTNVFVADNDDCINCNC